MMDSVVQLALYADEIWTPQQPISAPGLHLLDRVET